MKVRQWAPRLSTCAETNFNVIIQQLSDGAEPRAQAGVGGRAVRHPHIARLQEFYLWVCQMHTMRHDGLQNT